MPAGKCEEVSSDLQRTYKARHGSTCLLSQYSYGEIGGARQPGILSNEQLGTLSQTKLNARNDP